MAWPGHHNLLDFEGSGDFVPVGVGKLPLDPELLHFGPPKTGLSDDYAFMCQRMQVVLALLPPSTAAEYKLFHVEIGRVAAQNKAPSRTDMHRIARTFLDRADGKVIFPKTVEMLQKHYVSWKFNQRLKDPQLRAAKTVDSLSTAFAKQRLTAPAIRTFKLHPATGCLWRNNKGIVLRLWWEGSHLQKNHADTRGSFGDEAETLSRHKAGKQEEEMSARAKSNSTQLFSWNGDCNTSRHDAFV
jgi:hypothetical protein